MEDIIITNLSFSYPGQKPIFEKLNLAIQKGQFVGIVGPNGAGKSTLLKLILSLLTPQSGRIYLRDQKIGYVPQRATTFNSGFPATVEEVVSAPLKSKYPFFQRLNSNDAKKLKRVLDYVGLSPMKNLLIGSLSGGQQQRAFIARALVTEPSILFLDEPFVGIDQFSQEGISGLLHKLNKEEQTTIIIITHDLRWVEEEVNLMVCLEKGSIHCHQQIKNLDHKQHIIYHNH